MDNVDLKTKNQKLKTNSHFQQSDLWRKLKESVGNKTYSFKEGWFQTTKIPLIGKFVGYVPPIDLEKIDLKDLYEKAKIAKCAYVTIDNNKTQSLHNNKRSTFQRSNVPTFQQLTTTSSVRPQHNVIVDLTKAEDELFNVIDRKVRYNIRYAEKKGVKVEFSESKEAFEVFLKLFLETKRRQKFYGRGEDYLRKVWETFQRSNVPTFQPSNFSDSTTCLVATASFDGVPLVSWLLIGYGDTLYYPYGGSSSEMRNLKANYLQAWEVVKFAKVNGYKFFDWMGVYTDKNGQILEDGFSAFKVQFGGEVVKYEDSVDLIISPVIYKFAKFSRWLREKLNFLKKIT